MIVLRRKTQASFVSCLSTFDSMRTGLIELRFFARGVKKGGTVCD